MTQLYESWLNRKLDQEPIHLRRPWTMSRTWKRITGGRIMFAEITLTAEASDSFSYVERIVWPTDYPYFKHCVLDGILDGVLIDLARSPSRMSFSLERINWHEEQSVPRAYYCAARELVGEIFGADERELFLSLLEGGPDA